MLQVRQTCDGSESGSSSISPLFLDVSDSGISVSYPAKDEILPSKHEKTLCRPPLSLLRAFSNQMDQQLPLGDDISSLLGPDSMAIYFY
mmetsp:Transcript_15164/g.30634  ORF Transcript_15164/g.30634 Transcript_15164/m.30634 type:complete len:89 (-) Transcript_15164:33-299(-)